MSPFDPLSFSIAAALLVAAAFAGAWLPARRAARIEPMDAMMNRQARAGG